MPVPELPFIEVERTAASVAETLPRLSKWTQSAWSEFHRRCDAFEQAVQQYKAAGGWPGIAIPPPFQIEDLPPWLDEVRNILATRITTLPTAPPSTWILEFSAALGLWWEVSRNAQMMKDTNEEIDVGEATMSTDLTPAVRALTELLEAPIPIPYLVITDEVAPGAKSSLVVKLDFQPQDVPISRRDAETLHRLIQAAPNPVQFFDPEDPDAKESQKNLVPQLKAALSNYGDAGEWIANEIESVGKFCYRLILPRETVKFLVDLIDE